MSDNNINIQVLIDAVKAATNIKDLNKAMLELTKAQKNIAKTDKDYKNIATAIKGAQTQMKALTKEATNSAKELKKAGDSGKEFGKTMGEVGKLAGVAFSAETVVEFGKKIFEVTAEFQKMEASLTQALGDKSVAAQAMEMIDEVATNSPFKIKDMTEAFNSL